MISMHIFKRTETYFAKLQVKPLSKKWNTN